MEHDTATLTGANLIAGGESRRRDETFAAVDPRTGQEGSVRFHDATSAEVERTAAAAAEAAGVLADLEPATIAAFLRAAADELEALGDTLIAQADFETALGETRLAGERARTCGQLRAFAELVEGGRHFEAIIDTADPSATPPQPDLRRMLIPVGPVAVFGASNFPLAFSVPGGDTASALAAGCPVIAKAHPSHPGTSELSARAIIAAAGRSGLPDGTFSMVQGRQPEVGRALVLAEKVKAVGFTGSSKVGRALFDLGTGRDEPIPVYAEMGSLNPVFVSPGAAAARAEEIAAGYAGSMTLGAGQFCTKPGLIFVPADEHGDHLVEEISERLRDHEASPLLNAGIRQALLDQLGRTKQLEGVETVVEGPTPGDAGWSLAPTLLQVQLDTLLATPELLEEHFGPASIVVRTASERMLEAADALEGSLTATVHGVEAEFDELDELTTRLREKAGRLIWNGFPTGVAVAAAQHHGGPYPATTAAQHTSVGITAIRRFQRPVAYQNAPNELLPPVLRDANPLGVPRLVNGEVTTDPVTR